MKSLIISSLILIAASGTLAQNSGYKGSSWSSALSSGSGTVQFSFVQTPRFVYHDASGKLTGISVDIMNDFIEWVKKNKKVKIDVHFADEGSNFSGMYKKVKSSSGGVFGLGNITITNERKKEVKFSPPFITNFAVLVSHGSMKPLNQMEDITKVFAGSNAYTAKGTTNETRMKELQRQYFKEMKLSLTSSSQETLDKIIADPKGFGYLDLAFYLEAVQNKKNVRRHPIGDKAAEQFGFIMPLSSDWLPVMEEFFNADGGYTASKSYRAILQKHLGEAGMKLLKTTNL